MRAVHYNKLVKSYASKYKRYMSNMAPFKDPISIYVCTWRGSYRTLKNIWSTPWGQKWSDFLDNQCCEIRI